MDRNPDPSIQSVQKAISILKAFTIHDPELGVNELSRRVGLHKSTVSRLLSTLEQAALVERDAATDKYRLGVELIALAGLVISHADVRTVSRGHLRWLAELTEETVNLAVPDGTYVINVEQIPSSRLVRDIGWIGRRSPLHCTSTGKVLLAHMPTWEIDKVLAGPLAGFSPSTITDPDRLRGELSKVLEQGFAIGQEELEEGLNAVAAPVRNHEGRVVAAVSVSGPSYRVSPGRFTELSGLVKEAADRVSRQLGYVARYSLVVEPVP
jgi:DNA-binding IclR family transcriptional regulator